MRRVAFAFSLFALLAAIGGCFLDRPYKHRNTTVPEDLGDGWAIAPPASVGIDPAVLASIHEEILREDQYFGILGLLIIKDGKLVFETYTRSVEDRDRVHPLQSVTKSVTALVLGAARDRGLVGALDTTLCSIVGSECAALEPAKQAITLDNLLTMRSGIAFDNSSFSMEIMVYRPDDPLRYILEKPMYAAPGAQFYYRDADPQLVSHAIQRLTGRTLESLGVEFLLQPLGVKEHFWDHVSDGTTTGGFGLHLRPRDFARLGQLMLDGCRWGGAQVVSSEWCTLASTAKVDVPGSPFGYGYYFWVTSTPQAYAFFGHGGQFALVVPSKNLVAVQIALPYTSGDLHGARLDDFVALTRPLWQ
jgi:CubicO group peptidase (beta-lactamase class C family)